MRNLLIVLSMTFALGGVTEAGTKCCTKTQNICCSLASATKWYKAKDGTFREMMPYMQALDRAEDADDMEPVLKQTQSDLAAANAAIETAKTEIEAVKAESAKLKADMEAQLAELQTQLVAEKQAAASQKERADKAEAAHKVCIEEVAQLREQGKKQDEALASTKGELKTASEERDSLKTVKTDLEKQVADLEAAKKAVEDELAKMKQEAAEAKKAAVEGEPEPKEGEDPAPGDEKPPEPGTEPAPEAPAAGN